LVKGKKKGKAHVSPSYKALRWKAIILREKKEGGKRTYPYISAYREKKKGMETTELYGRHWTKHSVRCRTVVWFKEKKGKKEKDRRRRSLTLERGEVQVWGQVGWIRERRSTPPGRQRGKGGKKEGRGRNRYDRDEFGGKRKGKVESEKSTTRLSRERWTKA